MAGEPTRSPAPTTIPEVGIELRHLRDDFSEYQKRHELERQEAMTRIALQHDSLREAVERNTEWRLARQAQEQIFRWLVGSNVGVLIGIIVLVLGSLVRAG